MVLNSSRKFIVASLAFCVFVVMPLQEGCNNDLDILLPGGTTPSQSEIEGQTIADQIEIDAELEDFEIRRIPSNTGLFGPKGSLYGAVLEDSLNSVYVLGEHFSDGTVEMTGVRACG